jgi:8-oxo-dGTP pyrophosphatase MutT (NUDIX family)
VTDQQELRPDQPGFTHLLQQEIWPRIRGLRPNGVRAVPAATLILIDRSGKAPKVLMGRRSPTDRFMPNKFVFPGGRVDPCDAEMNVSGALSAPAERRLQSVRGKAFARCLPLAAIRETFEETGLVIGTRDYGAPENCPEGGWRSFAAHGAFPDLGAIHFVGRATTPPRLPRRYDTIFLAAEADNIVAREDGAVGPDKELVELVWVPISEAYALELPTITAVILRELEERMAQGMPHEMQVPWYRVEHPTGWRRLVM